MLAMLDAGGGETPGSARYHVSDGRNACFVPADAAIDDVGAGALHRNRQAGDFVGRGAAFDQIKGRDAIHDQEPGPQPLTRAPHAFDREAMPVLLAAAEFIVAIVGPQCDELVDQVTLGTHDLHTVEASAPGQFCTADEIFNGLPYFGAQKRARYAPVDG